MSIKINEPLLRRCFPRGRADYIAALVQGERLLREAGLLESPLRLAHFFAQIDCETGGMTITEESGNYSAERLLVVFGNHFTRAEALRYAHKPEAALSRAYANRMGNRGEASRDGWNTRGRGFNQLTGTDNYREYGEALNVDLLAHPELAADPRLSLKIALREWALGDLNTYADRDDILSIRRWINCGSHTKGKPNGLPQAKVALARFKRVIASASCNASYFPAEDLAKAQRTAAEALAAPPEHVRATPSEAVTVRGLRNAGDRRVRWLDRAQSAAQFLGLGGAISGAASAATLPQIIAQVREVYEPLTGNLAWLLTAWPAVLAVGAALAFAAWRAKEQHAANMEGAE